MERIKNIAYFIYILSLIPGDTFYGDLGLAQSYFLFPIVILFFVKTKLTFNRDIIYPLLFIIGLATFYLLLDFKGAVIEWYRIIGNLFLVIVLPEMYKRRSNAFLFIPMILIGFIPAVAFYLGFWELKLEYQLRLSFLRHDPNILSYNLLFGYISALYFIRFNNAGWLKKYLSIFVISAFFLIPILATISRTALVAFVLIFIVYIFFAERKKINRAITLFFALIVIIIGLIKTANNELIGALTERIAETDDARTGFIDAGLKIIKNNFFTGVGLSNFGNDKWRIYNGFFMYSEGVISQTASHNGIMDILMIGGIFFLLSFLYIIFYPIFRVKKTKYSEVNDNFYFDRFLAISSVITFIVINLTYSSYMSKTAWTAVTLLYIVNKKYSSINLKKYTKFS